MAKNSTALERMRRKALEARPTNEESVSGEALRLRTATASPGAAEKASLPSQAAERGDKPAPGRKLSAFGRMTKRAFGSLSPRREKGRAEAAEPVPVPDAVAVFTPSVVAADVDPIAEAAPVQAAEPANRDEATTGRGILDEVNPDHADDYPQPERVCREKIGWVSPSYTVSRPVRIDPQVVARNKCVAFLSDSDEVESYRVLRTQILQRSRERGGNTVMITSALPGEGKTLTAINLALTFAKEFRQTALLVDCDLRRQRIHELLGIESARGLNEYLLDDCPIPDLMVWPGVEKLTLISGGRTISESSELLGSPRMKELVEDMKNRYPERYVIFDVPAVLSGADALAFAPLVDHIVITVRAGETPMPEVTRALKMLPREKVLGLVLNRRRRDAA